MMDDNMVCRKMVQEMLDESDRGFTPWELDFLESVRARTGNLTDKQKDTIEKIYKRRM